MTQHDAPAAIGIMAQHYPLPQIERVDELGVQAQQQAVVILHHLDPLVHRRAGEAIGAHRLVEQLGVAGGKRSQGGALEQLEHPVQLRTVEQTAQQKLAAIEGLAGAVFGIEEAGHIVGTIVPLPG